MGTPALSEFKTSGLNIIKHKVLAVAFHPICAQVREDTQTVFKDQTQRHVGLERGLLLLL